MMESRAVWGRWDTRGGSEILRGASGRGSFGTRSSSGFRLAVGPFLGRTGFGRVVILKGLDGTSFLKGLIGGSRDGRTGVLGLAFVMVGFVMSLIVRGSRIEGAIAGGALKATLAGRLCGRGGFCTDSAVVDGSLSTDGTCKEEAEVVSIANATFFGRGVGIRGAITGADSGIWEVVVELEAFSGQVLVGRDNEARWGAGESTGAVDCPEIGFSGDVPLDTAVDSVGRDVSTFAFLLALGAPSAFFRFFVTGAAGAGA